MKKQKTDIRPTYAEGNGWIEDFVPYQLYRVTTKLNAKLVGKLRANKINPARWRVLSVLRAFGMMSLGKVVEFTLMEQSTVSKVVGQLEQEGLVVRRWSQTDARVVEVSLTDAGGRAFEDIVPTGLRHQAIAFAGFSAAEIASFRSLLRRIEDNIEAYQ